MKQLPGMQRLAVLAVLMALALLGGAGCQESKTEKATPAAVEAASTTTPAPVNTPIQRPDGARSPEPTQRGANVPTIPTPPTHTPIPMPTATPAPTPESDEDFTALYRLLDSLEGDTRVGDLMDALAESEVACLEDEVDEEILDAMTREPALAFATIPYFLTASCIETDREADITVAIIAGAVGGLAAETERRIRDEISENYGDDPFRSLSLQPRFMSCLDEGQALEISVSEISGQAGGVEENARDCLRRAVSASFLAASELQSGNPQDSLAITIAFREAAIYGCLSDEQVAIILGTDVTTSASSIGFLRNLYTHEFPMLYNSTGPKIFGSSVDLNLEERAAVESFHDSRAECRNDPAGTYPTPDTPAPTPTPVEPAQTAPTPARSETVAPTPGPSVEPTSLVTVTITLTPEPAAVPEPGLAPTPTDPPTPGPREMAASRLLSVIPWIENPESHLHKQAAKLLINISLRDSDLGNSVAGLQWIADGMMKEGEVEALVEFENIAAIDMAMTVQLLSQPWFADGISRNDLQAIDSLRWTADMDVEVARLVADIVASSPNDPDAARNTTVSLAEMASQDSDLAKQVASLSWLRDGVSLSESIAVRELADIASNDTELASCQGRQEIGPLGRQDRVPLT